MAETFLQRQTRLSAAAPKPPAQQTYNAGTQANHQTVAPKPPSVTGSPVSSTGYPSAQTQQVQQPAAPKPPTAPTSGFNAQPYQGRPLNQQDFQAFQQQGYGTFDPNKMQGAGNMVGNTGYEVYHAGTGGWQMRQPGQQPAAAPAPGNPAQSPALTAPISSVYGPYPGRPADTSLQAVDLGNNPFATYQAAPQVAQYNAPQAYQGSQFNQFAGPNQQAMNAQQTGLMSGILSNPHSMNAQAVAQLKERQKESALAMARQLGQQSGSAGAARGLQNTGSNVGGAQRAIDQQMVSQVLGGNRDIDIQKMQQDRQDELQALSASESLQAGQLGRSRDAYSSTLLGQDRQATDNRNVSQDALTNSMAQFDNRMRGHEFNADQGFKQFSTERDAQDASLQRALSQFGVNQAVNESNQGNYGQDIDAYFRQKEVEQAKANLSVQQSLGQGGLGLDAQKLAEQRRQFNLGHALDRLQFGEGARQFNSDLGFRYNNMDQNATSAMVAGLLR